MSFRFSNRHSALLALVFFGTIAAPACSRRSVVASHTKTTTPLVAEEADAGAPHDDDDAAVVTAAAVPKPTTVFKTLPNLEVQAVEETGLNPKGAFLSNDKKTLYVTNFGQLDKKKSVSIYDAETLEPRGQLDLPGEAVEAIASHDDKTLYVSSFWGHSVMFVDLASKAVTNEIKVGYHPKVLALSHDGKTLYVANWSGQTATEIDLESATVTRTFKTGKNPRGLSVTSGGMLLVRLDRCASQSTTHARRD